MAEVLIVDDDPDIRGILAFTMEDAGYVVREAGDGAEAIAAMEKRAPDCVVLDLMMPGLDGFEVLEAMREQCLAPDARVVILSCQEDERAFTRGYELQADQFFVKPVDPDLVALKISALIEAG